jgi:hypothetical protein
MATVEHTMHAHRVAWASWGICVVLALPTLVLLALGAGKHTPADDFGLSGLGGLAFLVATLAFATTGALIASRVGENPIGWIFCVTGFLLAVGNLPYQYADYTLYVSPGSLPGGAAAAVAQNLTFTPCFGLLGASLLLFPDGRLPSPRWRPALGVALAGSVLVSAGYALRSGRLDAPFESVSNPFGVGSFALMNTVSSLGWMLMAAGVALAGVATVQRLRRSRDQERQQLKWIGLAGAVAGAVMVVNAASFFAGVQGIDQLRLVIVGLACAGFPVAAGTAILRYRLYDIDVVINRALVYGALTATLAVTYLASVLVLQLALAGITQGSGFAVAASTLAAAGLFRPARARIQAAVDRRFYRRRYDARRTLEDFGTRLRDEVDLDALSAELRRVVGDTMQPAHVSLWLRAEARPR